MPGNLALAFGALVAGAVVIDYGVKNARSAIDSAGSAAGSATVTTPTIVGGFPESVNPLPGANASRLDQGIDATGKTFLSPWSGRVVYSQARDSGWRGGGYIAVQSDTDSNMVYYLAEGITPTRKVGDNVKAGDPIAQPIANPYNGIVGNVEAGRANPLSPGQPLAQVVSNPAKMVDDFYQWLLGVGGPKASNLSAAGRA